MQTILITGFGPFKDFDLNPSDAVVSNFSHPDTSLHIEKRILPVDFQLLEPAYTELLDTIQPSLILNVGLKAGAGAINLEQFAVNAGFDGEEEEPEFFPLPNAATTAFQTSIDLGELSSLLCSKNIPTLRSNFAGTYLCNYIYYRSLLWAEANQIPALFIHIPFTTALASEVCLKKKKAHPSLPEHLMIEAIQETVTYTVER